MFKISLEENETGDGVNASIEGGFSPFIKYSVIMALAKGLELTAIDKELIIMGLRGKGGAE